MGAPVINASEFAAFVLVLLRLSMVVAFAPIIGSPNIVTEAKVALALTLSFVIAPLVAYDADLMPMTWFGFAWLAIGELIMGLTLAFMVRLVLETANLAGEYLSFQMSMTMVNLMDPQSGAQVPVVSRLVYIIFIFIFLIANGHLVVIKALVDSFDLVPPGLMLIWRPESFTEIIQAIGRMYILAVKIAAPVVGLLFCTKVSFGIVAKAVPQMQVLFVGMPLYILAGLALMGVSMDFWPRLVGQNLFEAQEAIKRLLTIFSPF
ncbi:MAG: flagellar biosynthetic protein FliR [Deltaproteobacteria bacterium]|jgi:flagellar biosynthetic protein FliR|nr:flagellar biosynthetic protein FliR [Deltaproteobacteria bacterium]